MRSGYRVHLSGDGDDIVTLLVVIGRKDYGPMPRGGTIIDVGAHLGAFTLEAMANGARRVYSYEPDPILHEVLLRNVMVNGLAANVTPCRSAVVGSGAAEVVFVPAGNASGHVTDSLDQPGGIRVKAVTLAEIILNQGIEEVDLLKLDCEGSEYGIVFDTPDPVWEHIRRVRLEYHYGRDQELRERFEHLGFTLTRSIKNSKTVGLLWFDRP